MSSSPRVRLAAAVATAGLTVALTGCGVTGTSFQPGVAADVDGARISTDHVNQLVGRYCDAIEDQLAQEGTVLPLGYLRSGIVGQLALVKAAEKLATETGVEVTQEYDLAIADLESQTAELPEDQQEAVVEVNGASAYLQAVQLAVGQRLLEDEGQRPTDANVVGQRGAEALAAWLEDHDVEFNPEFGIGVVDGQLSAEDTQLAFDVSGAGASSVLDAPDQELAQDLPASQRCG